jgi:hypothetical protein
VSCLRPGAVPQWVGAGSRSTVGGGGPSLSVDRDPSPSSWDSSQDAVGCQRRLAAIIEFQPASWTPRARAIAIPA